jgi:hypothetical protein
MSVELAAYLVQFVGLTVLLIYGMPWKGRAPRNRLLGIVGAVVMGAAAAYHLILLLH